MRLANIALGQRHNFLLPDWDYRKKWTFGCAEPGKQKPHYLLNVRINGSGGWQRILPNKHKSVSHMSYAAFSYEDL